MNRWIKALSLRSTGMDQKAFTIGRWHVRNTIWSEETYGLTLSVFEMCQSDKDDDREKIHDWFGDNEG